MKQVKHNSGEALEEGHVPENDKNGACADCVATQAENRIATRPGLFGHTLTKCPICKCTLRLCDIEAHQVACTDDEEAFRFTVDEPMFTTWSAKDRVPHWVRMCSEWGSDLPEIVGPGDSGSADAELAAYRGCVCKQCHVKPVGSFQVKL